SRASCGSSPISASPGAVGRVFGVLGAWQAPGRGRIMPASECFLVPRGPLRLPEEPRMPRKLIGGLIQCANPLNDATAPIEKVKQAMFDAHVPFIEEAGKKGVQVLCLQEIFNGPYFCPSQDPRYYDMAEPVPGPTSDAIAKLCAKHQMAVVVPIYEKDMPGVLYNTAAVYDADGSYLGKYRKNHIPHTSGFWEKYYFKPGNL